MRRAILVALGAMTLVSSAAAITFSAADNTRRPMGVGEYRAARAAATLARGLSLARCAATAPADARESCDAGARAHEALRAAEIEAGFRASEQSLRALHRAQIEVRYQATRARCASLSGSARDDCYIAAHALKGRALLDSASPYEAAS